MGINLFFLRLVYHCHRFYRDNLYIIAKTLITNNA